jgi:multisubunit Na+/H+ antiporter MnhB subunit
MDLITRTSSRIVALVILFFGMYIILHGHISPGGSFPGGVVIASVLALTAVVFGIKKAEMFIGERTAHIVEALVALALCTMVLFEFFIRKILLSPETVFQLWSAWEILILNIAGGLMVSMALILIIYVMIRG